MAQRRGTTGMLSVMQELQQLRGKVCILSEKNRDLAKALTATKQDLTKARAAQSAVFSDKVVEWMEARCKPIAGKTALQHQAIQCSFGELSCASMENTELEPEEPLSPSPRASQEVGVVRMSPFELRAPSPFATNAMCKGASTALVGNKIDNATAIDKNKNTGESDDTNAILSDENGANDVLTPSSSRCDAVTSAHVTPGSERLCSQAGMKRRLRQRNGSMSYTEPKLNTKLRRGDYYGLGKRTGQPNHRQPKSRMISGPPRANSAFVPALFGQQRSPFEGRRTTRPVKRVSYAEPKLNTKLRQGDKFTFTT